MSMVRIDWHPDAPALRRFGVVVLVAFAIIGAVFRFGTDDPEVGVWVWIAGAVLGLPGLTGTVVALPGYWVWMGIAFVMGNIMSRVLLTAIYYGMFTPIGLARRMLGKDPLQLRRRDTRSYWRDLEGGSASTGYERQF